MATGDFGVEISSRQWDAAVGTTCDVAHVRDNIYAIVASGPGNDGWIYTISIDVAGNIGAVIDSFEFAPATTIDNPKIIFVSIGVVAVVYNDSAANQTVFSTFAITAAGAISAIDTFTPVDIRTDYGIEIRHISGDVFAVVYGTYVFPNPDRGNIRTFHITAAGNITAIDNFQFEAVSTSFPDLIHVSGNIYAVCYGGPGDIGQLHTVDIDDAGNIGGIINSLVFEAGFCAFPRIIWLGGTGNYYAISYAHAPAPPPNQGHVITLTIDGAGTISGVIGAGVWETVEAYYQTIFMRVGSLASTVYLVPFVGAGHDGWMTTFEVSQVGVVGAVIDTHEFDVIHANWPRMIKHALTLGIYIVVYRDAANGMMKTIEIDSGTVPTVQTDPATGVT